ncbi:MAG TPA: hypothetical protein VH082_03530 [Rudaea sp.]|jgi:hypothetical protein|nr:hypothetical protein [Rudaea sp.]
MELLTLTMLVGLTLASDAPHSPATQAARVPIFVAANCADDPVAAQLIAELKRELRRLPSFGVVDSYKQATLTFRLICSDPNQTEKGNVSRYAYSILLLNTKSLYDYELNFGVGRCGLNKIVGCAEGFVGNIDGAWLRLQRDLADGSFEP